MQHVRFKMFLLLFIFFNLIRAQEKSISNITNRIDEIFNDYQDKPGCAIGIFKEGNILYQKAYGLANLDYDIPIHDKTVFDLASVSKQFTAACIFLLEIDGKLHLDDPIQKYIPEIPVYQEGSITISNLIHHTSGLRDYLAILHSQGISWDSNIDNQLGIQLLAKQKGINFKPNSQYAYSNTNYLLLSEIVQRVIGKSIGNFAKEKLFEPLGMNHTFFYEDKTMVVKNRAIGYEWDGEAFIRSHFYNSMATGDGGVCTTIEDLFKWNENLKTGKVGGTQLIGKMLTTKKLANGATNSYAGGLFRVDYGNIEGLSTIRHSGEWAGARALYFKFLEQDVTFVILSNNANTNVWDLVDQLIPLFFEKELEAAQNQTSNTRYQDEVVYIKLNEKDVLGFCGDYYNILDGTTRKLLVKNDTLIYKRSNGIETKLLPISKNQFVFKDAPFVKLNFGHENELQIVIQENAPLVYKKYLPISYTASELQKYEGIYYSEELEVDYEIKPSNNNLQILINSKPFLTLTPVTEHVFNAEHFGYLEFIENNNGIITGFTRNDDIIMNILFARKNGRNNRKD